MNDGEHEAAEGDIEVLLFRLEVEGEPVWGKGVEPGKTDSED